MIDETRFMGAMNHYRDVMPRFAPNFSNPNVLRFWHQELGHLEPARLKAVFDNLMRRLDHFPTLADVRRETGVAEQLDADIGRDVAERLYAAIARGWATTRSAAQLAERDAYVGDVGLEVVRLAGGWHRLSELQQADATIHKAQWRELAGVLVRKARAGRLERAPEFPALPQGESGAMIAGMLDAAAKRTAF